MHRYRMQTRPFQQQQQQRSTKERIWAIARSSGGSICAVAIQHVNQAGCDYAVEQLQATKETYTP